MIYKFFGKAISVTAIVLAFTLNTNAQTPTWAADVAPIMYSKCTSCHHPGGIGPMSFMSYGAAKPYASFVIFEVL